MDGSQKDELALHQKFAEYAVIGEWFEPSEELLAFCSTLDQRAPAAHNGGDSAKSDIYVRFRLPSAIYERLTEISVDRKCTFRAATVSVLADALALQNGK